MILSRYGMNSFPIVVLFFPKDKRIHSVFRANRIVDALDSWIESSAPVLEIKPDVSKDNNEVAPSSENSTNTTSAGSIKEDDLKSNETKGLNETEAGEASEFMKKEFLELKEKITSLENEIGKLKEMKGVENKENNNTNNKKNRNKKWIIEFEVSIVNIAMLCGVIMILIAVFALINKLLRKNKEFKGE